MSDKWVSQRAMVQQLKKPGKDVLHDLDAKRVDLWYAVTGICTEAGELLDAIKKHVIYNKPLDLENVVEELGDIEFYMEQVRQNVRVSRDNVVLANIEKLSKRYSNGYSDQAAQARSDKS